MVVVGAYPRLVMRSSPHAEEAYELPADGNRPHDGQSKTLTRLSAMPALEPPKMRTLKIAVVLSHPVQYHEPLFRGLSQHPLVNVTVLYCDLWGATRMRDPDFGSMAWDVPLLTGYRCKRLTNFWPWEPGGFFGCINPGILVELWRGSYDAAIVFGWGSMTMWMTFAAASLVGTPWMLYGDTNLVLENGKHGLKHAPREWLLRGLFKRTAAFLASGTLNRMFYESKGVSAERIFAVPASVDNDYFSANSRNLSRGKVRAKHGISSELTLLLFVGRLSSYKRPLDILRALALLQARFPRLGVAYAGEGAMRGELEAEVLRTRQRNIFFLGFKNQSELPEIYACADALVLPSSEPRGMVAHEAMACGLPLIVSDRTGVWGHADVVRHGENGFVYRCGDIEALAEAIGKLVADPGLRRKMGERSKEVIRSFSYAASVDGILKATEVITRRARPAPPDTTPIVAPTANIPMKFV